MKGFNMKNTPRLIDERRLIDEHRRRDDEKPRKVNRPKQKLEDIIKEQKNRIAQLESEISVAQQNELKMRTDWNTLRNKTARLMDGILKLYDELYGNNN